MSRSIKNVAITGASGNLGGPILNALVSSGKFNVKVLRRNGSKSTFGSGIQVVDVDFDSVNSLAAALAGQDALVAPVGFPALGLQKNLIDAAVAAGVHRFMPSDFGSDLDNQKARELPVFVEKIEILDYLLEKTKTTPLTYTAVSNGVFLDWGLTDKFILDFSEHKPTIYDGGDTIFSATSIATIAEAVVGILLHPEETKNRRVYIEDIKLSQNKVLDIAKKLTPGKTWEPQHVSLDDVIKKADERMARGQADLPTLFAYIYRTLVDPAYGPNYLKTDNELLGIKGKTEDDVVNYLKPVLN